jgi:hypothetical protein
LAIGDKFLVLEEAFLTAEELLTFIFTSFSTFKPKRDDLDLTIEEFFSPLLEVLLLRFNVAVFLPFFFLLVKLRISKMPGKN